MRKIRYESETCGRCGGSGTYPSSCYNGVCLGCHGDGRKLTRRGQRARALVEKKRAEVLGKRADEVRVGDHVRLERTARWRKVTGVQTLLDRPIKSRCGQRPWVVRVPVELSCDSHGLVCVRSQTVLVYDDAGVEELFAYAGKLKGAEVYDA